LAGPNPSRSRSWAGSPLPGAGERPWWRWPAAAGTSGEPEAATGGGISRGAAQGREGADLGAAESRAHRTRASHGGGARRKKAGGRRPDARSMPSSRGSGSITGSARSLRRPKRGRSRPELPCPRWGALLRQRWRLEERTQWRELGPMVDVLASSVGEVRGTLMGLVDVEAGLNSGRRRRPAWRRL
jgi:hypothetical protein